MSLIMKTREHGMKFRLILSVLIFSAGLWSCTTTTTGSAEDMPLVESLVGNNTEVIKSLSLSGSLLFTSSEYRGMNILNVSDKSNVTIIGTNYFYPTDNPVNDIVVKEGFVFLALGNYNETGGLAVVDANDTNAVTVLVTLNNVADANSKALVVSGTAPSFTAYVADENRGLTIYAIDTGVPSITVSGVVPITNAQPVDIVVNGTTAYVAGKSGGAFVVTGLGGTPKVAANLSTEISDARGVALSGDGSTLYVADRMLGIWAYSVASPAKPSYLGNYETPGEANALVVNGTDVYVADGSNGLLWIDYTTPSQPELKKQTSLKSGIAWDVALAGSFLIGAYGPDGIKVFSR